MKNMFEEFIDIYKNKPIKDNTGGMKIPHMFGLFQVLKRMNPSLIVESGVWRGQGTWFMRQVCPDATIISFDVYFGNLEHKDSEAHYVNRDITTIDWNVFFETNSEFDPSDSLLFLDDHVNFSDRLNFIYDDTPFKYVMYEDNYPPTQGDCVSPKKIRECDVCIIDKAGNRQEYEIPKQVKDSFSKKVKSYEELSPVCIPPTTRWGDKWEGNYSTPDPVFEDFDFLDDWIKDECRDYTWICFMELNER